MLIINNQGKLCYNDFPYNEINGIFESHMIDLHNKTITFNIIWFRT
jgi:hypothetical protein